MTAELIKFGQFVQQTRQFKGITQKELSLKVFNRLNIQYISNLENGKLNNITFKTASSILKYLNCEMTFKKL